MIDTTKPLIHFKKHDPAIYRVLKTVNFTDWFDELSQKDHFKSLVSSIIGQQLSGKAARTIRDRVLALMPTKIFTPEAILVSDQDKLRSAGMAWAKVRSLRDLSERVLDGRLELTKFDRLSDETVMEELVAVKGIGPWTAEMFLIFNLGRENIFSYGDAGLRNGIKKLYSLPNPTHKQIAKIIAPWKPYRSFGCIALWHSLDNQ